VIRGDHAGDHVLALPAQMFRLGAELVAERVGQEPRVVHRGIRRTRSVQYGGLGRATRIPVPPAFRSRVAGNRRRLCPSRHRVSP
jgi:hypothetical protein